jgi:uncharacterized membrane protein (DUF485 family)
MWVFVAAETTSMYGLKFPFLLGHYKTKLANRAAPDSVILAAIVSLCVLMIVFTLVFSLVVYYAAYCTGKSPTDNAVTVQRVMASKGIEHLFHPETGSQNGDNLTLYCTVCEKYVEG